VSTLIAADLAGRRAAAQADPSTLPSGGQRDQSFKTEIRAKLVEKDNKKFYQLDGCASTVNQTYQMYDFWGPYDEKIDPAAFDKTLAADPDVAFLLNHRGTTMARTKSGTLTLSVDEHGLQVEALTNAERQDVRDMVVAINDGDIDQMSFAFRIVRGQWSPDYTEYTILEVDLDRGDVSAVNFGANPYTSISARAQRALDGIDHLEGPVLRAIVARAEERLVETETEARGSGDDASPVAYSLPSVATLRAQLELGRA
jgi:HK97 family phage prohead protease